LGCRFVILTTGHGLVTRDDVISPYDMHIRDFAPQVSEKWHTTVEALLGGGTQTLMLFYAGGCPRDSYLEILRPILHSLGTSLITFGRPNMFDVDKIGEFTELLVRGALLSELKSILKCPERLECYFHI
jgi:hypothetical protein